MPDPSKETLQAIERPESINCYHCGDVCDGTTIRKADKAFCCSGCKSVYEILEENQLVNYYDLEKNPGKKVKEAGFGDRYSFLDEERIVQSLLNFA
ncbi:MAG: heavy metal translocating P-type ATPase metal-binding domain-containing protein, partial [Bacteroidota bacterium]